MKEQLKSSSELTRQGVLARVQERIHEKNAKGTVKKQSKDIKIQNIASKESKIAPKIKISSKRPIEQILIGAWNAAKPESQGKVIMKVYDKYFIPKYKTKEEAAAAKKIRPKVEKIVGLTAVSVEAGIITLGLVKGYKQIDRIIRGRRLRKRYGNALGSTDLRPVAAVLATIEAAESIKQAAANTILKKVNAPDFFQLEGLSSYEEAFLRDCYFTGDLRQKIHQGIIEQFVEKLPDLQRQANPNIRMMRLHRAMLDATSEFLSVQLRGIDDLNFWKMRNEEHPFIDIQDYTRVFLHVVEKSGMYDQNAFDGYGIENLIRPRRVRKIAGK